MKNQRWMQEELRTEGLRREELKMEELKMEETIDPQQLLAPALRHPVAVQDRSAAAQPSRHHQSALVPAPRPPRQLPFALHPPPLLHLQLEDRLRLTFPKNLT